VAQQAALDLKADTSALATKLNTADLDTQAASKISTGGTATQTALSAAIASAVAASGSGVTKPKPAQGRLWGGLARAHETVTRLVHIGDSNTYGSALSAATMSRLRWQALLAVDLQREYNDAGVSGIYFMGWDGDWTKSGTITQTTAGLGANAAQVANGATLSRTVRADRFTVYHQGGNGSAGAYTVTIDGGAPTTITPSSGASTSHSVADQWASPQLTLGDHTIVITGAGASTIIDGVYCHAGDYDKGLQSINGGRFGATVDGPLTLHSFQRIKALAPAGVTYQLVSNNFSLQSDLTAYKLRVSNFIERVLADVPNCVIVLLNTHPRGLGTAYAIPEQSYIDQLEALAAERPQNVFVVNTGPMFPQTTQPAGVASSLDVWQAVNGDHVHMNGPGHQMVKTALFQDVFLPRWRGAVMPAPEIVLPTPVLRLDPATLSVQADSSDVTSWASTGSDTSAAVSVATKRPTYQTNGASVDTVKFASGQYLSILMSSPLPTLTIITAHKADPSFTGRGAIYNGYATGQGFAQLDHLGSTTPPQMAFGWGSLNQVPNAGTPTGATWLITALTFTPGDVRTYINQVNPASKRASLAAGSPVTGFTLGASANKSGSLFVGELGWMEVYSGALTQVQIAEILKPLAAKFNLNLGGETTTLIP
jgi:hypothetical protein